MSEIDTITKQYVENPRVFADAFNFLLYNGEQIIKPENLHPLNTAATEVIPKKNSKTQIKTIQKMRDALKYTTVMADDSNAYMILGIENQSEIHYAMPARNMLYDAMEYSRQIRAISAEHRAAGNYGTSREFLSGFHKDDKLVPVITLVLYFGADPWDGPTTLHDMIHFADDSLRNRVANYQMQLLTPNQLSAEDFDKFHSSLRQVMGFIKYSTNKERLEHFMQNGPCDTLDEISTMVINHCTNVDLQLKDKKEETTMSNAWNELKEDYRKEGENIRAEKMAKNMLQEKEFTYEKIAKYSELSLDKVKELAEQIAAIGA